MPLAANDDEDMRWFLALGLAGCAGQSGTDVDTPACGEQVGERAIASDEEIGGQTASELAAAASGSHELELTFYGRPSGADRTVGSVLTVEVDLARARELRWRTKGDPDQACTPTIDLPARVQLTTDDGTLSGSFTGSLTGGPEQLTVFAFQRRAALDGSYDSSWYAENPNVALRVWMSRSQEPSHVWSVSISMEDVDRTDRTSAEVADS